VNLKLSTILVLALLAAPVWGQEILDVRERVRRQDLSSGISHGTHSFLGNNLSAEFDYLELRLSHPKVSVTAAVPLEGPTSSAPLWKLAQSSGAVAAMGWELAPSLEERQSLPGMSMTQGKLFAWPPEGPQVVFHHEGGIDITALEPGAAKAVFDDGTELPILSINGDLPRRSGEAAIYTGTLSGTQMPATTWPEDLQVSVLESTEAGADPHALFLDTEWRSRKFLPRAAVPRIAFQSSQSQAVLLLRGPLSEEWQRRLAECTPLRVDVQLDRRAQLAQAVLPAGRMLMQDGIAAEGANLRLVANAVALDRQRNRVLLISTGERVGRRRQVPVDGVSSFLLNEGYTDLMELPERTPLLLVPGSPSTSAAGSAHVRLALAVLPERPSLSLPTTAGDLERLFPGIVEGTRREFMANRPGASVDERLAFEPGLGHFWGASFQEVRSELAASPGVNPNGIRFVFGQGVSLHAVELIHAEAAGFSPQFDLKQFRLVGRLTPEEPWRVLAEVNHEAPQARERIVLEDAPILREVRLEVLTPSFLPGGSAMRLVEAVFWGERQK
jgi:hypothetical protein